MHIGRLLLAASGTGMVQTVAVDGALRLAGVDRRRVAESNGSLLWGQCASECGHPAFDVVQRAGLTGRPTC